MSKASDLIELIEQSQAIQGLGKSFPPVKIQDNMKTAFLVTGGDVKEVTVVKREPLQSLVKDKDGKEFLANNSSLYNHKHIADVAV